MSSKVITESLYNSLERSSKEIGQYFVIAHRANIIKLSYKHGVSKVADMFSISRSTIYFWANSFKREGLEGLKNKSKHQGGLLLKDIHRKTVKEMLQTSPSLTIKEVGIKLEKKFNLRVSKSSIHLLMKDCGFSYITSRPQHYKQNQDELNEFKKNSYQN